MEVATNVKCPKCVRKLCKIIVLKAGTFIEIRHRKMIILSAEIITKCISCKREYQIKIDGSCEEVTIERE